MCRPAGSGRLAGFVEPDAQSRLRYDVALNGFGEDYDFQPWVNGGRPNDTNNIQPDSVSPTGSASRPCFAAASKCFGEVTDQSAHGTVSWRNIVGVEILNDGRPDFASNPFNGPQPMRPTGSADVLGSEGEPGRRAAGASAARSATTSPAPIRSTRIPGRDRSASSGS